MRYDLKDIEVAIRWLKLGSYLAKTEWGLRWPWVHTLTDKGRSVADAGEFPEEEKKLFYRV